MVGRLPSLIVTYLVDGDGLFLIFFFLLPATRAHACVCSLKFLLVATIIVAPFPVIDHGEFFSYNEFIEETVYLLEH